MIFKKNREIDKTYFACNNLTHFEYEMHAITGNGSYVNLHKLEENSLGELILGGF